MKITALSFLLLLIPFSGLLQAKVIGKNVSYSSGKTIMKGYIAYDDNFKGKRPGVLVVHEWWGHNDYARKRADMLAELGYTALAVDMYGNGKQADHPEDAMAFSSEVKKNMKEAENRFLSAITLLKKESTVDKSKIAAIGYCFGGGIVLEMARMGVNLKGVASFHGSLGTSSPATKGGVKARVLVMNGEADPFVKKEQIENFKKEMESAGANYKFIDYPGAKHAFTNPAATDYGKKFGLPLEYNQSADEKSWEEMKIFLKEIFK